MHVIQSANIPSTQGGTFTGNVNLQQLRPTSQAGDISVTSVQFEDGARTLWHDHPCEQLLLITEGEARAGTADEEIRAQPGDFIYLPAGERHWHGAVAGGSMTHLSFTTDGPPTWYEAPE